MKNLYQVIHIIGAVQGVFLFLLLIMRKENKTANKILAFLILLVSINLTTSFFHTNNDSIMDIPAINRSDVFIFLYGPLLAAYTMFLTGYRRRVSVVQALQLIPGFCLLILLLANNYGIGGSALLSLWDESYPVALRLWFVIHFGSLLHMLLYAAYGLRLVYQYDLKLRSFFSNTGRIYLRWLRTLLTSIIFICFAALIQFLAYNFGNTEGPIQWVISAAIVILVYIIGYYTNRQPDILKDLEFIDGTEAPERTHVTQVTTEKPLPPIIQLNPEKTLPSMAHVTPEKPLPSIAPVTSEKPLPSFAPVTSATPLTQSISEYGPELPERTVSPEHPIPSEHPKPSVQAAKVKYERNRLGEEEEQYCLGKLIDYVEKNKPYLEPDLDLRQLSEMSGIPSHIISMLLNIRLNRNFYTFINSYRVDEAKRLLSSGSSRETNILTIAYESGFNSKSTFNMVFRKLEGITPSEFRSKYTTSIRPSRE